MCEDMPELAGCGCCENEWDVPALAELRPQGREDENPAPWHMYDVPVTFSILAPHGACAEAYVRELIEKIDFHDGPAYEKDHAFVDGGSTRKCDCVGH